MTFRHKAADLAGSVLHGLGKRIDRFGTYAFLDARQAELGDVRPVDFEAVLYAFTAAKPGFSFIQIGAHKGEAGDPLRDGIRALSLRGVLVEPQPGPFDALKAGYADQPQLSFEQAAIAEESGTVRFYRVDPAFWARHGLRPGSDTEISSLKPEQIRFHVALFGGDKLAARESEYLVCDVVPALTLADLQARHDLPAPDLIQIDAEGFDDRIVRMIDWSRPPALVHYETVHLSEGDRLASWALLRGRGYRLYSTDSHNTLAIRRGAGGDSRGPPLAESASSP